VQNTADLLRGDRSSKIKEPSAHGTLQRTQAPGRIPKSDDESSRETLLIMLPGDRSRKVKDPSVHGTQQLIGSPGTTLSLGHRSKGPTQCIIGTQDFSKDFGNNKFRKWLTSDCSNIAARAQLLEDERERMRRRSRATAMEQYLRNVKDGPTKFCTCCGGTWFPS